MSVCDQTALAQVAVLDARISQGREANRGHAAKVILHDLGFSWQPRHIAGRRLHGGLLEVPKHAEDSRGHVGSAKAGPQLGQLLRGAVYLEGELLGLLDANQVFNLLVSELESQTKSPRDAMHEGDLFHVVIREGKALLCQSWGCHAEGLILVQALEADSLAGGQEQESTIVVARDTSVLVESLVNEGSRVVADEASLYQGREGLGGMLDDISINGEILDNVLAQS